MSDDWFRRRTWSDADRTEFFSRLGRSRSAFHKAQYVRIQALELHESGGASHAADALELLDLVVERWMEDAQGASVHYQRAECLRDLGRDQRRLLRTEQLSRNSGDVRATSQTLMWTLLGGSLPLASGTSLTKPWTFLTNSQGRGVSDSRRASTLRRVPAHSFEMPAEKNGSRPITPAGRLLPQALSTAAFVIIQLLVWFGFATRGRTLFSHPSREANQLGLFGGNFRPHEV